MEKFLALLQEAAFLVSDSINAKGKGSWEWWVWVKGMTIDIDVWQDESGKRTDLYVTPIMAERWIKFPPKQERIY